MITKASKKETLENTLDETTNVSLVNSILRAYFNTEITKAKEIDFTMLKGEKKKAFIRDMDRIQELITEGYNATMDFISYSLSAVK